MTTTRSQSQAMSTSQPTVAPQEPESPSSTPSQEKSGSTPSQASPESTIPLKIQGVITYFNTCKLTKDDFKSCDNRIEMTANSPDWDPSTNRFQEQEDAMLDDYGRLHEQSEK